jgi:hypothetical protein
MAKKPSFLILSMVYVSAYSFEDIVYSILKMGLILFS